MTTTCRDLIRATLRKLGVIAVGKEPSAAMAQAGLEELQSTYDRLVSEGRLGRLTDVLATSSPYTAKAGQRIAYSGSGDLTVTLPATEEYLDNETAPEDGDQSYRKPLDLAPIVLEGGSTYIYDAGAWREINGLGLSDEAPLAGRYRSWLIGELAIRLADEYGVSVPPSCLLDASMGRASLAMKLSAAQRPAEVSYF